MDQAWDLARERNACAFSKTKPAHIFVELLVSQHQSHLCGADIRGLHQNVMDVHLAVSVMIAKDTASVGKCAVLAVDEALLCDHPFGQALPRRRQS